MTIDKGIRTSGDFEAAYNVARFLMLAALGTKDAVKAIGLGEITHISNLDEMMVSLAELARPHETVEPAFEEDVTQILDRAQQHFSTVSAAEAVRRVTQKVRGLGADEVKQV